MELEHLLGARLLDRTTRRVGPTEAGLAYYEQCIDIIAQSRGDRASGFGLHDEPRGVLKVNAPMSFGAIYLGPAIADFMTTFQGLKIELTLNDRFIDPMRGERRRHHPDRSARGFQFDSPQVVAGPPCAGSGAVLHRSPRRAGNPGGSGRA